MPKNNLHVVRPKLKEFIERKLFCSKVDFAAMVKVSPATITKWLHSKTEPSMFTLRNISRRLGMDFAEIDELFEVAE